MKSKIVLSIVCTLLIHSISISAGNGWQCQTKGQSSQIQQMINVQQPLIIIMVDFPDGRLSNGNLPTQDSDTALVANIDAVGSMGFDSASNGRKKIIRKYVYEDYWDMVYSANEYVGTRHPDYAALQGYAVTDDPIEGYRNVPLNLTVYGSVRDYWNEVSYGNLQIQAYQTRSGLADKYHTGIVNKIITANGKNYVRWIKLDNIKSYYTVEGAMNSAILKVGELHQLPVTDPEYLEFDITSYPSNGKIAVITAGGLLGGAAEFGPASQKCITKQIMTGMHF